MSAAAAVLAIVVAVGESQSPSTAGLLATATEALGPGVSIRLLEARDPTDTEALRIERDLGAGAVVTLTWKQSDHLHASVRLHVARTDRWTTRAISFLPGDKLTERGRTLGLAVGSMWPEFVVEPPPRPSAEPRPALGPEPTTERAAATKSAATRGPAARKEPAKDAAMQPVETPVVARAEPVSVSSSPGRRMAVGVVAVGALGIGGPARGLGVGADGVLFVLGNLSVRLGISLRGGPVPELPGTDFVGTLAAGLEWWPILQSRERSWGLAIRADALAAGHQVRFTGGGGQTEAQSRVLPGGDLSAHASFRLASRTDLVMGFGSELVLGNTEIRRGAARVTVATIPPARLVGQLGVRVGF